MRVHTDNAAAWGFTCLPGCGFCCATSPAVLPADESKARAGGLPVVRRADGTLGLSMRGATCSVLDGARVCSGYDARPLACRAFPVQLHALDRLQADLHLGCPGLTEGGAGGADLARRVADEAVATRALDLDAARANGREMRVRVEAMGFPDPPEDVLGAFAGIDATEWRTLAGLYAAAADPGLAPDDVAEAIAAGVEEGRKVLPTLVAEIARETPPRAPDHADAALAWKPLDLTRADVPAALRLPPEPRAVLARHLTRILQRDLTWGHALRLVDASGYSVSPAAAAARVLADAAAGLLLRAQILRSADEAVRSYEWGYWGLPTVGAAL